MRELYNDVYNGKSKVAGLPANFGAVASNVNDFDIDDVLVVKHFVQAAKQVAATPASKQNLSFDDLFVEDMVSRIVYQRDSDGRLYRIVNGTKTYYDSDVSVNATSCAGTQLNQGALGSDGCVKFVRDCLVSGERGSLDQCLANLSNVNLFTVAQKELENVDPEIAIRILKTFGFNKVSRQNSSEPVRVQSFQSWENTVAKDLSPNVRSSIIGNKKLCDYLKGVVSFVNSNPAILNPGMRNDQQQDATVVVNDDYLKALGKNGVWKNPRPNTAQSKLFDSEMLMRGALSHVSTPGMLTNPFTNVTYSQGMVTSPFGNLRGGSNSHEQSLIEKVNAREPNVLFALHASVLSDLERSGKKLNELDSDRLNNGMEEFNKIKERMAELFVMLRTLTDLANFFKSSGCVARDNEYNISLEQLRSRSDTLMFLKKNIGDLQQCIGDNASQQNSKCKELIGHFSSLFNIAHGKESEGASELSNL